VTNEELLEILKEVPNPEDEGYCEHCYSRLKLKRIYRLGKNGKTYPCDLFEHLETCYYGKIQRALGLLDSQ